MKRFATLYCQLNAASRAGEKADALKRYLRAAPPLDAAWAVFVLSGRKVGRAVPSRLLRLWAAAASGQPDWLVDECYRVVGDFAETLSLLVSRRGGGAASPSLAAVIEDRIRPLGGLTRERAAEVVRATWAELDADECLVFHKLLAGNFRVGVSRQTLARALADISGVEPAVVAHRLGGDWTPEPGTMARLLCAQECDGAPDAERPYPFMLAQSFGTDRDKVGDLDDWAVEWKWDGIRAQLIHRSGKTALWSRDDGAVAAAFPELVRAAAALPDGTVLDGEIVAWDPAAARPLPITALQQRLDRQPVEPSLWPEVPVEFVAFDVLEHAAEDVRARELQVRRRVLEQIVNGTLPISHVRLSPTLPCPDWDAVMRLVASAHGGGTDGLMLKRAASAYTAGRSAGHWRVLKREAYKVDAVLLAAGPGRGGRAGLLADYTFGVWDDAGALVPVTKADTGLTDAEIERIDRFARRHTTARHGPVRTVEPQMVFEIGFDDVQKSPRHRCGVTLGSPRILRLRKGVKPVDAGHLRAVRALLPPAEGTR